MQPKCPEGVIAHSTQHQANQSKHCLPAAACTQQQHSCSCYRHKQLTTRYRSPLRSAWPTRSEGPAAGAKGNSRRRLR